jgi:hypothetical protein
LAGAVVLGVVLPEQLLDRLREPHDLKTVAFADDPNLQLIRSNLVKARVTSYPIDGYVAIRRPAT